MQLYPLRLLPENTRIDFMRLKAYSYGLSLVLSLLSIIWLATFGLNFGIDFIGGISIEARSHEQAQVAEMREILANLNIGEVSLQNFGSKNDVAIRVSAGGDEAEIMQKITKIKKSLEKFNLEYRKIDFVGPQVGSQLIIGGAKALGLAFLAIMFYTWVRFEWQFGLGVLIALVHDTLIALGFMSLTQLDFNLASIAALLTIIGYSVNDSVVIYDRIRENLRKYVTKSIPEIINISVNDTLSRTTLTVLTTLIANLSLIIFGGEAIHSFSVLVFFGIIFGTYSSIFISAPILTLLRLERFK